MTLITKRKVQRGKRVQGDYFFVQNPRAPCFLVVVLTRTWSRHIQITRSGKRRRTAHKLRA